MSHEVQQATPSRSPATADHGARDPDPDPPDDREPALRAPEFELVRQIRAPRPVVHSLLCDLHRMVPLHPFIESIQDLPPRPELPRARCYRVVDRIPVGPLKLKTSYVAALDPVAPDEVHGHAWQSPGIRLQTIYALREVGPGTRLVERCRIDASRLLRPFVVAQARKAHAEMLDRMKTLLEAEAEMRLGA